MEDQKVAYDAIQLYENENVEVIPLFYIPSWVVTSSHLDMKGNPAGNDQFAYQKNILDWTTDRPDNTMYTNTGAVNFLEHPATNPALFWHQEVVFDRLLNANESLAPTDGQLAESFEVSEDGTVITFTLRDGVKWHDGEPFTAEDVKWTFEYYPTVPGANTVMTDVINAVKNSDVATAAALQRKTLQVIQLGVKSGSMMACLKLWLRRAGVPAGYARRPFTNFTEEEQEFLVSSLLELDETESIGLDLVKRIKTHSSSAD